MTQPNNAPIQHGETLTEHDADRSSGAAFYIGVLGYLAALPMCALMLTFLQVL